MLVKTFGSAVYGVEAITITVEVNVTEGLHTFIVGLADSAVKESIQRIESAIKSNGLHMPRTKIIVNLAPAGIRKYGAAFDLPIALGMIAAAQSASLARFERCVVAGELALTGEVRPIKGALPIALEARNLVVRDDRGVARLDDVSFILREGEILGVAGVAGNGQSELLEALAGIRMLSSGEILIEGRPVPAQSRDKARGRIEHGPSP